MFARLRLFLTCLLMAAVPLQGFTAASMLFCAAATHEVKAQSNHASASGQHDHSSHTHANGTATTTAQGSDHVTDAFHKCGLCAACCHSVAITELPSIVAAISAPRADLADPFVLIVSRPLAIPDKPPRA